MDALAFAKKVERSSQVGETLKMEKTSGNKSPDDGAWQNELTEEDVSAPEQRDDAAKELKIDPDIVNKEPVKPARGKG